MRCNRDMTPHNEGNSLMLIRLNGGMRQPLMIEDSAVNLRMRKESCALMGCECLGETAIYAEFSR